MDLDIRPVTHHELDDLLRCDAEAFGYDLSPEDYELGRSFLEPERTMAAFDGDRLVGASAALSLELTVPGPVVVPVAAVTYVAVLPTHRRRGVLRAMLGRLLGDAAARGEPVSALLASESLIYGRFGYGPATSAATYRIERRHAAFDRAPDVAGRFVLVDGEEARRTVPALFDRYRRARPGEVSRHDGWWRSFFADPAEDRDGMTRQRLVAHEGPTGRPDGYAAYRYRHPAGGATGATASVAELVTLDEDTRLALLRYCFELDLVESIELPHFPLDEPARWALADPRRLETTAVEDRLWARLLDAPAALAGRRYASAERLVLEVDDPFLPANTGRYELEAGPTGARCRVTSAPADVSLGAAELGAAYLGGVRLSTLAAAGRVREHTPGALARASALFAADPPPHCSTEF